jgi:ubiquinone/menaquinone biosynthesis C-methylase UbiE
MQATSSRKKSVDENLVLVESPDQVDQINSAFYSRFPYPWRPQTFAFVTDRQIPLKLLNQNLGDWKHRSIPSNPKIWVAGCGTNQAVYTALLFPHAEIIGSDLSPKSLEICARTAKEFQLDNLSLKQESINGVGYSEAFDLVISTGVIHHNAEPERALQQLVRAMKPSGVLELMVYNRFRRLLCSAFQKAVRLMTSGEDGTLQSESELRLAQRITRSFGVKNLIHGLLQRYRDSSEAEFADALIQPVEHSYTVESLNDLAVQCGLEGLSPVINDHDVSAGTYQWQIDFSDPELQRIYESMPDLRRWQFTNLLLLDQSPNLWFYFQRADSGRARRSQAESNLEFLDAVFEKIASTRRHYVLQASGSYTLAPKATPFPPSQPHATVAKVYDAVDGRKTMRQIFASLNLPVTFGRVLHCRTHLATSAFPFLLSTTEN